MNNPKNLYKRHRFPSVIIQHAVWLYYRFNLSQRDIEDLLAKRGIEVSYESIRLWCNKFGPITPNGCEVSIVASATRFSLTKSL